MPTIQSPGIGSGLDVNSLVTQLVAAERAPWQAQITRRETRTTVEISALGTLKGALGSFKNALESLKTEESFSPRKAVSADEDVFTASATGDAATGSYDIEVLALAKAHQLASGAFADGSASVVGTGELTITSGDTTFSVDIDSTNNTLAGIRDAINDAAENTGVQATLLNETGGTRLVLTSARTGAENAIRVTQSGGDGGLAQLVYDPGVLENLTQVQAAQDAHIQIAGFDYYSPTNTVEDAIEAVTLDLKGLSSDGPVTLAVSEDTALLKQRIESFVNEYNSLHSSIAQLRSYDPATKTAGPLLGDALLRGIESQISSDLVNPVDGLTGPYTTLAAIGITKQTDGTLKLDDDRLATALEKSSAAVAKIFGSENGVAARLYEHLDEQLESGAALDTRNQSLQKAMDTIDSDKEALDARMAVVEERYRKQFTALDALLAQLQTTSSYLAAQLANLPKISRD